MGSRTFNYFEEARRPLCSLVFLLPLILFYEIGAILIDHEQPLGRQSRVIADQMIRLFFSLFGATGLFLPGLLIIGILLATHLLTKQPWRLRMVTLLGMAGESFVCTLPLFMLNRSIVYAAMDSARTMWMENVVIGIGAGVYEELVFRLIMITSFMIVLEDVIHLIPRHARLLAVVLAAILFSAHHHPPFGSDPFRTSHFIFRTLSGLYLGGLYLWRGYGITAGCHALYNMIVVTINAIPE
ncbi:MAG: hypothetical protein HJJLKODD_01813 [Phycisphaerae bacterium]|nr:hypothetical protein [Phycisphaerae bacterium]